MTTVRPFVRIKVAQFTPKVATKRARAVFTRSLMLFKIAPKNSQNIWAIFVTIFYQELIKIAQSGHTNCGQYQTKLIFSIGTS